LLVLNVFRDRVRLLQNMVSNTPPHPLPATHRLYILYYDKKRGGRVEPERRLKGQQFIKLGPKYQHDLLYLQSINSDNLPQSPFTGQFF
jgi:hypothetical protein